MNAEICCGMEFYEEELALETVGKLPGYRMKGISYQT